MFWGTRQPLFEIFQGLKLYFETFQKPQVFLEWCVLKNLKGESLILLLLWEVLQSAYFSGWLVWRQYISCIDAFRWIHAQQQVLSTNGLPIIFGEYFSRPAARMDVKCKCLNRSQMCVWNYEALSTDDAGSQCVWSIGG